MKREIPRGVVFYRTEQGRQPIKEFLKDGLRKEKIIGVDISGVPKEITFGETGKDGFRIMRPPQHHSLMVLSGICYCGKNGFLSL